jgi:hypothetical protein
MFRAVRCSSSGGLIVSVQPLVSSLSAGDCPVHRCTGQSPAESDNTRGCIDKIRPPEDEQGTARNMYRILINVLYRVSQEKRT